MLRFLLPALAATLLLSLAQAPASPGMRVDGSTLEPTPAQAPEATAVVELGDYVVAASAAYKELDACTCCCATFDLPGHRCAACATTSAAIRQVVARVRSVQARLARLDVPEQVGALNRELVAAATVMHVSGDYMAEQVLTDPQRLVVAAASANGLKGPRAAWRPSPRIVSDARLAAFLDAHHGPLFRTQRLRAAEVATTPEPGVSGGPGEQAQTHLTAWREGVQRVARDQGIALPDAIFS
jgi:hypothetical protein